jgi:hypothetical protein
LSKPEYCQLPGWIEQNNSRIDGASEGTSNNKLREDAQNTHEKAAHGNPPCRHKFRIVGLKRSADDADHPRVKDDER